MAVNYTPHTWVTSEVVTAAELNTEIRDLSNGLQAAWTSYTPTLTGASVNPVINNGSIAGRWLQIGKTVLWRAVIVFGSTSTFGSGQYSVATPIISDAAMSVNYRMTATGVLLHSAAIYPILGQSAAGATLVALYTPSSSPAANFTQAAPVTIANGDTISLSGMYETA